MNLCDNSSLLGGKNRLDKKSAGREQKIHQKSVQIYIQCL